MRGVVGLTSAPLMLPFRENLRGDALYALERQMFIGRSPTQLASAPPRARFLERARLINLHLYAGAPELYPNKLDPYFPSPTKETA
jgi:hypothetical protein